jgi:hypothetical protein
VSCACQPYHTNTIHSTLLPWKSKLDVATSMTPARQVCTGDTRPDLYGFTHDLTDPS